MLNIDQIDGKGVVTNSQQQHYLIVNERLIKLDEYDFTSGTGRIRLSEHDIFLEFKGYKWRQVYQYGIGKRFSNSGKLAQGDIGPLRNRGILNLSSDQMIETGFDYIRRDKTLEMDVVAPFSKLDVAVPGGKLQGMINVAKGSHISSKTVDGQVMGQWGTKYHLDNKVELIELKSGHSGTVAIRIPLDYIVEGRPVIVSAGELSGSTIVYAVDRQYFYAYHMGQSTSTDWLTSHDGMSSLYQAHLAFRPDAVATVPITSNKAMSDIFSHYDQSTVSYYGQDLPTGIGNTRIGGQEGSSINLFDYNQATARSTKPRRGNAYAVLSRHEGLVSVTTRSEDLQAAIKDGKVTTLASGEYRLNGLDPLGPEDRVLDMTTDQLDTAYGEFSRTAGYSQRTLNTEWAVNDIDLDNIAVGSERGRFKGVYTVIPEARETMQERAYYIRQQGGGLSRSLG